MLSGIRHRFPFFFWEFAAYIAPEKLNKSPEMDETN